MFRYQGNRELCSGHFFLSFDGQYVVHSTALVVKVHSCFLAFREECPHCLPWQGPKFMAKCPTCQLHLLSSIILLRVGAA